MKRLVIIAPESFIHICRSIEAIFANEYTFKYHDSSLFVMDIFLRDMRNSDICISTFTYYNELLKIFPSKSDQEKIAFIISDGDILPTNSLSSLCTYGVTTSALMANITHKVSSAIHIITLEPIMKEQWKNLFDAVCTKPKKPNTNQSYDLSNLGYYVIPESTRGGICVDVGGNTGAFALKYCNFFSTIHVYEPQKECNAIIQGRIAGIHNVHVYNEAVYNVSNETLRMISHTNHDSGSVALQTDVIAVAEWDPTNVVEDSVNTICIEDLLLRAGGHIDYLKIDCETGEYNFLMNKDLSNIRYIGIELHWQIGEERWNKLMKHLSQYFRLVEGSMDYTHGNNKECFLEQRIQNKEITAIINVFKRPHILAEQVAAIKAQTIQPKAIFIWNNGNKDVDLIPYKNDPLFRIFDNSHNFGVWSRFILASMAPTEHICIFDDDTIPGPRWFENCTTQMNIREALYGTIGVIFNQPHTQYETRKRYGWDGPSEKAHPVDIVGHAWFFKRSWFKYYFAEEPQVHTQSRNGEDIHFSRMLQKYGNIPTYVPPHPPGNTALWGSMCAKKAYAYGCDGNSETFRPEYGTIDTAFQYNIQRGFRLMNHREQATSVEDLKYYCQLILDRRQFALIRPGDGEYIVMNNTTIQTLDNWTFTAGGSLAKDLTNALTLAANTCCHIGIPCTCCNKNMAVWYRDQFQINPLWMTFANLFVNNNWAPWIQFLKDNAISFTFVGPAYKEGVFKIEKFIQIPEFLVNDWDAQGADYVTRILREVKQHKHKIYMFSCGPIAKIMIAQAWAAHPYNIYLDIGSSLDLFMKGTTNRDYILETSNYSKIICQFTPEFLNV